MSENGEARDAFGGKSGQKGDSPRTGCKKRMAQMQSKKKPLRPAQEQRRRPGIEAKMRPRPDAEPRLPSVGKLRRPGRVITGGDSGIGRAVAVAFAAEGADVAVLYFNEHGDAQGDAAPG